MNNLEYLKSLNKYPSNDKERMNRQMRALEIIAEELIKVNEYLAYIKFKGIKRG
ncbi:hypothetical protein ES705_04723 [subsurface metagenome]